MAYRCAVATVLLIEDDPAIRRALAEGLTLRDHVVHQADSGLVGVRLAMERNPDVVILDLGLPDIDGSDLLRMLRSVSTVPVIVATARDAETEIVRVLDAGADDYVIKPFSTEQIDARVRAILRRTAADGDKDPARATLVVGGLEIDPLTRIALLNGDELTLSRKEFDLLHFLAGRAGEVVTKQELVNAVWRQPYVGMDKTVDTHLSWIRAKLGETAAKPRYVHTVRGVGVKLVAPG
jgi:two-component system, OmpR family, KDP operon response regulator KdpE